MPCVLPFVAPRRRAKIRPKPQPHVEFVTLINNLQLITLHRPKALKVCARVAEHYAEDIRRQGA
jgi:hypothetical protein